nr:ubiquitin-like protein ISG15 [Zootoca vivipara]
MALRLNVKLLSGEQYSLDTFASKTVWDFKIQVAQKTGLSPYQQKLACQSNGNINLQDSDQLSKFGLKSGDTMLLVVKSEESIPIFLHNARGQTKSYLVMPSDLVDQFKARIRQQENIQAGQFWLTYEGKPLDDGNKLSHYNIAPHGTVYLNLRLRGGCNLGGGPA